MSAKVSLVETTRQQLSIDGRLLDKHDDIVRATVEALNSDRTFRPMAMNPAEMLTAVLNTYYVAVETYNTGNPGSDVRTYPVEEETVGETVQRLRRTNFDPAKLSAADTIIRIVTAYERTVNRRKERMDGNQPRLYLLTSPSPA